MPLIPLIDRTGAVRAWADRSGWICNPTGGASLLIAFDGVFAASSGAQIGWWYGDHIRNRYGQVVLARPSAKIEGLAATPRTKKIPRPPKIHLPTGRPLLRWLLPPPPIKQRGWADFEALFYSGLARLRAFEKKAAEFANRPVPRLQKREPANKLVGSEASLVGCN
jgi:hypothetical protein